MMRGIHTMWNEEWSWSICHTYCIMKKQHHHHHWGVCRMKTQWNMRIFCCILLFKNKPTTSPSTQLLLKPVECQAFFAFFLLKYFVIELFFLNKVCYFFLSTLFWFTCFQTVCDNALVKINRMTCVATRRSEKWIRNKNIFEM